MALTASKYILPSGSPVVSNQSTQSSAYGDVEVGASLESLSSGLVSYTDTLAGTALSPFGTNFSHGDLVCRVVDNVAGSVTPFTVAAATSVVPTLLASDEITYIGANSADSTLTQQATPFTPEDRRTIIPIGKLLHHDKAAITEALFRPDVARAAASSFNDFLDMTGPVISGFELTPNTTANTLSIGAGRIMVPGIGMTSTGSLAPNTVEFVSRPDHAAFYHVTQDGTVGSVSATIDTTNVNPSGNTLTAPGSTHEMTSTIWQGYNGNVYVLLPQNSDTTSEGAMMEDNQFQQPVPHWLWEVAVPVARLTYSKGSTIFNNSDLTASGETFEQLAPIPRNWPHRTVQVSVFPS